MPGCSSSSSPVRVGSSTAIAGLTGVSVTSIIVFCSNSLPLLGAGWVGRGAALVAPTMMSMILSESIVDDPEPAALPSNGAFAVGVNSIGSGGVVKVTMLSLLSWVVGFRRLVVSSCIMSLV